MNLYYLKQSLIHRRMQEERMDGLHFLCLLFDGMLIATQEISLTKNTFNGLHVVFTSFSGMINCMRAHFAKIMFC